MKFTSIIIIFIFFTFKVFAHATIIIQGVEHEDGEIDVKVYADKESFLDENLATESVRKIPSKNETVVPLSNIHEGKFAIVVYHDENNDGKLNTGLFWRPKEGFAFSNKYTPKGPPKFKKAVIKVIHNKPIIIKLNY